MFLSSETTEAPCQSSCNEAVDVSHYPKSVGLLQLPPCRTAVVDTAACSKRRCPNSFEAFSTRPCHAFIEGIALAPRYLPHQVQDMPAYLPCSNPLLPILSVISYHLSATMPCDNGCAYQMALIMTFHTPTPSWPAGTGILCQRPVSLEHYLKQSVLPLLPDFLKESEDLLLTGSIARSAKCRLFDLLRGRF